MPNSSTISIYAELLPNIRKVSVVATLSSAIDQSTSATIFAEGTRIGIRNKGDSAEVQLPGTVVWSSPLQIQRDGKSRDLSWRLPLVPSHLASHPVSHEQYPMPWSADKLAVGATISCRGCQSQVVPAGRIEAWKDLPSENWAEMMEFWHCHKPAVDHDKENDDLAAKGYGARSAISGQAGVGFIDLTTFLFAQADVSNLETKQLDPSDQTQSTGPSASSLSVGAHCSGCRSIVGLFLGHTSSFRLFKWQISCSTAVPSVAPTATDCLGALLISSILRSGSSKSIIVPAVPDSISNGQDISADISTAQLAQRHEKQTALHIWVLNPHVTYATSQRAGHKEAIKLMYRILKRKEAEKLVEPLDSDIQEINLDTEGLVQCIDALDLSNELLPPGQRVYKEFKVGILDRYSLT